MRVGVFVYRLGHGPLKAERRVRFPYALPTPENLCFKTTHAPFSDYIQPNQRR